MQAHAYMLELHPEIQTGTALYVKFGWVSMCSMLLLHFNQWVNYGGKYGIQEMLCIIHRHCKTDQTGAGVKELSDEKYLRDGASKF